MSAAAALHIIACSRPRRRSRKSEAAWKSFRQSRRQAWRSIWPCLDAALNHGESVADSVVTEMQEKPSPERENAAKTCQGSRTCPIKNTPEAISSAPSAMIGRGPYLPTAGPVMAEATEESNTDTVIADEIEPTDQPCSSAIAWR